MAVDGTDGSGRAWFADALADAVHASGRAAHVVHVDDTHHLRAVRNRCRRDSPEGVLRDGYDSSAFRRLVLEPLRTGAAHPRPTTPLRSAGPPP